MRRKTPAGAKQQTLRGVPKPRAKNFKNTDDFISYLKSSFGASEATDPHEEDF